MLVTFDECYDNAHNYLILGALIVPDHKKLHAEMLKVKRDNGYIRRDGAPKEIKYTLCTDKFHYGVATGTVGCFIESSAFFRAIVIDQRESSGFTLDYFGRPDESRAMKEARAYKKFTELLLKSNVTNIKNSVLLTDRLTRCKGDTFSSLITELFCTPGAYYSTGRSEPVFRHIQEVDSALEQYQIGQIGDILQGVILNELVPTRNRWKRRLAKYVVGKLGADSLLPDYWVPLPKWKQDTLHARYQIWYWKPGERP